MAETRIAVQGCEVAVSETAPKGAARANLLFLHGRYGQRSDFDHVAQRLDDEFRSMQVDLPGFGSSLVRRPRRWLRFTELLDVLVQMIDTVPADPLVIVGHDLGGALAQWCSVLRPRRIRAMVLINTLPATALRGIVPAGIAQAFQRRGLPGPTKAMIEGLEETWPTELDAREHELPKPPTLILWGSQDRLNPLEIGSALFRSLRDSVFFQHDQAGHWPCRDRPEWVAGKMREFLFHAITRESTSRRTGRHAPARHRIAS